MILTMMMMMIMTLSPKLYNIQNNRILLLSLSLLSFLISLTNAAGVYDPCVLNNAVKYREDFTVGIVYLPSYEGESVQEDWNANDDDDDNNNLLSILDPCVQGNRTRLIERGAAISTFRLTVDTMSILRNSRQDEDGLMLNTKMGDVNKRATFLSIIAFARNIKSIPRVIRVKQSNPRLLTDFEGKFGRVSSLTLLAKFDQGTLKQLQWSDFGCAACGGVNSLKCLNVGINATDSRNGGHACMLQNDADCECLSTASASAGTCAIQAGSKEALKCQTTVSVAFAGTDKKSRVLNTGSSIEDLGKYSTSNAYSDAIEAEL
jgi:hypothetical protein